MLQNKDIETLRMLFSSHNYVMTTAELTASKYCIGKQSIDNDNFTFSIILSPVIVTSPDSFNQSFI